MTSPSISLTEQMLRRRPVIGAPVAHGASDHLKRSIGTFQLTMFGVGATVGTGIFFVLSTAVPEAGPGVIVSFLIAGVAAGLATICYAEMASAVPVSGSTYDSADSGRQRVGQGQRHDGCDQAYIGLDAVSTAGDEVKNPQRTMPRAIIAALLIVTSVYILVAVAALGAQPWKDFEDQSAGLAVILDNITGNIAGSTILAAGAVISIFSVTLVVMYGQTRILFAMGRDGLLPSVFARVNPRTMTPVPNTVIVAVVVAILAGFLPLNYLADMVSIGTLTAFIVVSIGVIVLRVREPDLPRGFKVPLYPATPILSVIACGYILYKLHWYTWIAFSAWVVVALLFYLVWSRHHSALNPGGSDGLIPTAAPEEDEVLLPPKEQ